MSQSPAENGFDRRRNGFPSLLLLTLMFCCLPSSRLAAGPGPGDLLVAPTRIVFEGRQRTAEITLVNLGEHDATYRIGFVELQMDEFGGTREYDPEGVPEEKLASGMIRYSPRQVLLEPGVAQTVRLQLRKSENLPPGEYRSHLLFRAIPQENISQDQEDGAAGGGGIDITLTAIYGVSIPVLVRHGELTAQTHLGELELAPGEPGSNSQALLFRLERTGTSSVFGHLRAEFLPLGGRPIVVGAANGVAVYAENASRRGRLTLQIPPEFRNRPGVLVLRYETPAGQLLSRAELSLK